jgi:hypothetical protein
MSVDISIQELRKKKFYRFYEGSLGIFAISFFVFVLLGSYFYPAPTSILLLFYGFFWLLKISLNTVHTIYGYKQMKLWQNIDWPLFLSDFSKQKLIQIRDKTFGQSKEFTRSLDRDIETFDLLSDNFKNPLEIFHGLMFSTYNESSTVLLDSLEAVLNSGYPLDKLCVAIAQEERIGTEHLKKIKDEISKMKWVNVLEHNINSNVSEQREIVRNNEHETLEYSSEFIAKQTFSKDKVNIFFVVHPDGMVGEIKGKASNEDYCARHLSLIFKAKNINADQVLISSFDADSTVSKNYLQMLSYKYCISLDRDKSGFQSIPVFANNYFNTHTWPRVVAGNTTLWTISQISTQEETKFFSTYCVPLTVLQKINFWQKDVIGEDATCFTKAYCKFDGDFNVKFFYGVFTGDSMESDNYGNAVEAQYLQLRRWAWGGVENFPFILYNFYHTKKGKSIPWFKRLVFAAKEFYNHGAWSTTPIIFSIGVLLPSIFRNPYYISSPLYNNISLLTSLFARIAFINVVIFSFITYSLILKYNSDKFTWLNFAKIAYQSILSSVIYVLAGIPAFDSQMRALFGKYLGYWVAPKK